MSNTPHKSATPMMAQYLEIKSGHPDALLFYRMGDFYEMFFDDAVQAAEALDIALTKRGKHQGEDIAMCGVPHHAAEGYFLTLIRKGFRVAVCEQLETPAEAKKRGYKAVVKRGVTRLVTPGTLTEDSLLNARSHNFLAAWSSVRNEAALAWADISTGAFHVTTCPRSRLTSELARLAPGELLVSSDHEASVLEIGYELGVAITPLAPSTFDSTSARQRLQKLLNVQTLDGFGRFDRAALGAMGGLVEYLELTQKGKLPLLQPPQMESVGGTMQIDAATRRNLEITHALSGGRKGSLLSVVDATSTAGGARLLERRLSSPSMDIDRINERLDAVSFLVDNPPTNDALRHSLRAVPDIDRALSRLALERAGPRDLAAIRNGLIQAAVIASALPDHLPSVLAEARLALTGHEEMTDLLDAALVAEPPLLTRDGGFVAAQYDPQLDEARTLRDEGRAVIAGLQSDYTADTGITALKIKHNNVLGYFIETPATHASKMLSEPLSERFIHRQTTANAVRFTTVALSELETKILNAGQTALDVEKRVYSELSGRILAVSDQIFLTARALATLDLTGGFARLACRQDWTRPALTNDREFRITDGRHPVVEAALTQRDGGAFIANDCALPESDNAAIWMLTGPNMSGKSTFLRQNALIALLAQSGSFVPATSARLGVVSQLFSRVGASDDLARGRSTFMVEMVETAAILNQADDRAFVILDEIGRGTATWDGLSIAWATLEYLHEKNRCRTLFATHYHELTQLAQKLAGVENATVAVREHEGDVIFLHEVRKGAAERSYGVQVARLAGLPDSVVSRARTILEQLEDAGRKGEGNPSKLIDDLPLFSSAPPPSPAPQKPDAALVKLEGIEPDSLTPKQALDLIYDLKSLART